MEQFEDWWTKEGQFIRSGGGHYEKSFAYAAWMRAAGWFDENLPPLPPVNGYGARQEGHYSAEAMKRYAMDAVSFWRSREPF